MLLACTPYYDAGPSCLIRSIRTVCKYRKCSFLTGLITSLTELLQDNHQGRIGTSKTTSTGSPVPAPIASLSEFFRFELANFFCVLAGSLTWRRRAQYKYPNMVKLNRIQVIPRALQSSSDVPVLLLNQPNQTSPPHDFLRPSSLVNHYMFYWFTSYRANDWGKGRALAAWVAEP